MDQIYDIAIIGSGPAGMSAAVNCYARDKSAVIFEGSDLAKKISWAPEVDNYLGFSNISGEELANKFINHIKDLEVPIIKERVIQLFPMGDKFTITTNNDNYQAKKIILAIGVVQEAKINGEADYIGQGISYCATCDGRLYKGKDVLVISDSNHHEEEANFLADLAENVFYIAKYKDIKQLNDKIEVIDKEIKEIDKKDKMIAEFNDEKLAVDGIFILRESIPPNEIVNGLELNGNYVKVDESFATNVSGVYAAGDCVGSPFQIGKAVGEGQLAALNAIKTIDNNE